MNATELLDWLRDRNIFDLTTDDMPKDCEYIKPIGYGFKVECRKLFDDLDHDTKMRYAKTNEVFDVPRPELQIFTHVWVYLQELDQWLLIYIMTLNATRNVYNPDRIELGNPVTTHIFDTNTGRLFGDISYVCAAIS